MLPIRGKLVANGGVLINILRCGTQGNQRKDKCAVALSQSSRLV